MKAAKKRILNVVPINTSEIEQSIKNNALKKFHLWICLKKD